MSDWKFWAVGLTDTVNHRYFYRVEARSVWEAIDKAKALLLKRMPNIEIKSAQCDCYDERR